MPQQKTYLDNTGEPTKQYLDEQGNPIIKSTGQRGAPPPGALKTPQSNSGQRGAVPPGVDPQNQGSVPAMPPFITKDDLLRVGKNMAIGAVGMMGGEVAAPLLAPALSNLPFLGGLTSEALAGPLSSIGMAGTQAVLEGNPDPNEIAKNAFINETSGRVMEGAFKIPGVIKRRAQEIAQPGSLVDKYLKQLGATYSEYTGSSAVKFIEDTFAPLTQRKAFKVSQNLAKQAIDQRLSQIANNPVTLDDYRFLAANASTKESANYYASAGASTAKGELLKGIAKTNLDPIMGSVTSPMLGPNGLPIITNQVTKTIEGPIKLDSAIINAKTIVDEITPHSTRDILTHIIIDSKYNKLQQTAANILLKSNTQINDKTNQLISHDAVSFENAWEWKKDLGNYIADAYDSNLPNIDKKKLNLLRSSLNNDITNGIPKWQNNNKNASTLWTDLNKLVAEREDAFFPEEGQQLGKVALPSNKNTSDAWHKIIDDNNTLSKVLLNPKMPEASAAGVPVQNPRKELASFKLADIWDTSRTLDKQGNSTFNTAKFFEAFNDPTFMQSESKTLPSSRDLLYSKGTQDDVRRFATALGKIEQAGLPSKYFNLKNMMGGIALSAGLGTYMLSGSAPTSALIGGGIVGVSLAGHQLAKTLINKESARVLVAMSEDAPLGMPERFAARIIGNVLKGEIVNVMYGDGHNEKVTLGEGNKK